MARCAAGCCMNSRQTRPVRAFSIANSIGPWSMPRWSSWPKRRVEAERIDEAVAAVGRIAPGERFAVGALQRAILAERSEAFLGSEHDGRRGGVGRQHAVVPDVLVVDVGANLVDEVFVAKAARRQSPAILAERGKLVARFDAAGAMRERGPARVLEPIDGRPRLAKPRGVVRCQMPIVDPAVAEEIGK